MGISRSGAAFLGMARSVGVDFSETMTLGHQTMVADAAELQRAAAEAGVHLDAREASALARPVQMYADAFLEFLGAGVVGVMDYSDFEGADVIHDLNQPLPADLSGRYTLVIDGGTSEHVFRILTALENSMRLVAVGGHLVVIVPANQQLGHGFYQMSPEFYFRALGPGSGFEIRSLLLQESGVRSRWLRPVDPAVEGRRREGGTIGACDLFVLARRTGTVDIDRGVMQSDYQAAWGTSSPPVVGVATRSRRLRERVYASIGPASRDRLRGLSALRRAWSATGFDIVRLNDVVEDLTES